jgi:hypothetical protein
VSSGGREKRGPSGQVRATIAWNPLQIVPIVAQFRAEGQVIDNDILGLKSPLSRKHVNSFGEGQMHQCWWY